MSIANPLVGQPINRVDGILKVTGAAKYAGEIHPDKLLHGYIVSSTISKGSIKDIDASMALDVPGVVEFIYHGNRPSLAWFDSKYGDEDAPAGSPFRPLKDEKILCNGQPIGLVIADSFEAARYAATLVQVTYKENEVFETDLLKNLEKARKPKSGPMDAMKPPPPPPKGNFETAYAASHVKVDQQTIHGQEHHNPIELFTSTAIYEGKGKLTVYDKTQGVINCQHYLANVLGLHQKDVRIISPFVGGGFGSGLRPQYQLVLAAMAALKLKRNVRVTMNRHQMFGFGHRPATVQHIQYGADDKGKLNAINHKAWAETSRFEDYTEVVVSQSNRLYRCENVKLEYDLVPLDIFTPMDMRAPGGSTGSHPIESGMDQVAHELKMDPLELRLLNYSDSDPGSGKLYTSKELKACYIQGAEKFGWFKRNHEPRSMKRGDKLVGMGMATGIWEALQVPAQAEAVLGIDGKLKVSSATSDIGTGTYTIMTQIAADEFGMAMEDVTFSLGDSNMPMAPVEGGSFTASSVGIAVKAACTGLKEKILKAAKALDNSPFTEAAADDVYFDNGKMILFANDSMSIDLGELMNYQNGKDIRSTNTGAPDTAKLAKYTRGTHSASFVEVEVDEEFGLITVTRALTAVAAGKIINPKTARSQILGSMVWGISKVLREESVMDHRYGRIVNQNLGEYHIPVHADIYDLDVIFVEENDKIINEMGIKGVGEIGLVGMPPAIANAVFHATGVRVKKFPIHLDALL